VPKQHTFSTRRSFNETTHQVNKDFRIYIEARQSDRVIRDSVFTVDGHLLSMRSRDEQVYVTD